MNNQKPTIKKLCLLMPEDLHHALKVRAAEEGVPMVDIIKDQVRRYLAEEGRNNG